jgi:stage II sporulation protein AA (anti-sigma F factor antagonist)
VIRPDKFEITETQADTATTVSVTGELDMHTTELLRARLSESLRAGISELTLDLQALGFMDSTGLRLLIELNQRAQKEGWRLRLLAPTDDAAALVLRVTAVDTALPFESPGA